MYFYKAGVLREKEKQNVLKFNPGLIITALPLKGKRMNNGRYVIA